VVLARASLTHVGCPRADGSCVQTMTTSAPSLPCCPPEAIGFRPLATLPVCLLALRYLIQASVPHLTCKRHMCADWPASQCPVSIKGEPIPLASFVDGFHTIRVFHRKLGILFFVKTTRSAGKVGRVPKLTKGNCVAPSMMPLPMPSVFSARGTPVLTPFLTSSFLS